MHRRRSDTGTPGSPFSHARGARCGGFTLIEVILVVVLIIIISSISVPYYAGTMRGMKLRSAASTIERMCKYGRSMAIMRQETLTLVLNHETMQTYVGGQGQSTTNTADGELDLDVLERLGYLEGDSENAATGGIDPEIRRNLPEGLYVEDFEKDWNEDDDLYENLYLIHFYPNGQTDRFELELMDNRGKGIKLVNDPISGRVTSEFLQ